MAGPFVCKAEVGKCAPQRAVQLRAVAQVSRFVEHLDGFSPLDPEHAWTKLIGDDSKIDGEGPRPPLVANRCNLLDCSAGVDPLAFVNQTNKATLAWGDAVFGKQDLKHARAGPMRREDRGEYAQLVVGQLRVRKVVFCKHTICTASIFTVGKSSGGLREVWNGHDLSAVASPPVRPPHLAGVTALLDLEASDARPIRVYF